MLRMDLISKYIIVCSILHNICLLKNNIIDLIINKPDVTQEQSTITENDVQNEDIDKRNATTDAFRYMSVLIP